MKLSGLDLKLLMLAVDNASYGRGIQVTLLDGIAFCRSPATYFPGYDFVFSLTTVQGTTAGIFREKHESPELTQGDRLQILTDFIEAVPHHGLCDASEPELTGIALCRSEAQIFNGHTFLFQLKTRTTRKANIFMIN
jgi:hypothetical protein